ncbi:glutathione peroxidase [Spongorhabdus nitratireducens]
MSADILKHEMPLLNGQMQSLEAYRGKVLLIVNTASNCGFTPQYKGLEAVYEKYQDQGLVVLGFPCNQFGEQEKGSSDEIAAFCEKNYGVTFPVFEKIEVNGDNAAPLYQELKKEARGILGTQKIKWNFTKFLVGRDGKVIERFAPTVKPESIEYKIRRALKA